MKKVFALFLSLILVLLLAAASAEVISIVVESSSGAASETETDAQTIRSDPSAETQVVSSGTGAQVVSSETGTDKKENASSGSSAGSETGAQVVSSETETEQNRESSSASSGVVTQVSSSETIVDHDGTIRPKVIDRINFPDLNQDFSFSGEDDLLEIWFPPIRDQDAAIFLYQDQVWMLDCGDERSLFEIVPLLRYLKLDHIDRVINTHPHHDHLNGFYFIDRFFPIRELMICFPEDATAHMTAAMEYCKGNGIRITQYGDESVLLMGDGLVSFVAWMKTAEDENLNDRSAQFMISYGACNMLSMADMELHGQHQLYDAVGPEALKADILRYPHHGKRFMVAEVFDSIRPALTIITNSVRILDVAESTRFLDSRQALAAYTGLASAVVHLVTNGQYWLCETVPFNPRDYMTPAEEEAAEKAGVNTVIVTNSQGSPGGGTSAGPGESSGSVVVTDSRGTEP